MKTLGWLATAATLLTPLAPAEAKTAFQYWAQGQGAHVSSKHRPRGGLQDAAEERGALPRSSSDVDRRRDVPPPYGYGEPGY